MFWQGQWESAVKSNALPPAAATGQAGKAHRRHTLNVASDQAFSLLADAERAPVAPPPFVRGGSPSRTLVELTEAGFSLTRGTVTTSDWRLAGHAELARSSIEGDGGDEFSVEFCFDADDQMSIELLCHNCGGAGHPARLCPSPKKLRTSQFLIALHTSAAKRKEENGLTKYGAGVGGRRPPPRGQRTPFKPMPKRFSASTPFRKFLPGNAPGASGAPGARPEQRARAALQAARDLAELANVALAEAEHAARSEDDADGQDDLAGQLSELVLTAPETPAPSAPAPVPAAAATPTSLEIPGRVMPSVFSSEGFYVNVANEVELQQPQPVMGQPVPSTLDVLPSNVLAHVVGLSAEADLFVLCGVSHGFQLAVHEHVDGVFAAEERARKADFDFLRSEPSSATDTDDEIDEATPCPRSHGYFRFLCAVAAVSLLTWLISCALAVRSAIAWVFEAVTDASVMLPAGLSTILIIILFAARAQAYPAYGDLTETALGGHIGPIVLPYDVTAAAPAGHVFDLVETCKAAMATLATGSPPPNDAPAAIRFCWDSGCTCYCIQLVAGRGRLSTGLHPSLIPPSRRVPDVDVILLGALALFLLGSRVLPSRQPWQLAASKTKLRRSIPRITI